MIAYGRDYDEIGDPVAEEPLGPVTISLSDVKPEHVSWLWPGRLPAGKLVVLDGDPAVGKSTLAVDLGARVSVGATWPDGTDCPTGDVLILSAEDGLADTIRPRLDAAGGDPARVHALTDIRYLDDDGQTRTRPATLADAKLIEQTVRRYGVRLVIIDVLMAYLPGKVDSHRDQDIRSVLSGLAAMAEATGCCILLLRHLNKATGGNPLYRGGGSIGIIGAARAAFLAAVDPDDDSRRVLACTKSNLAGEPDALAFRLTDSAGDGCARVVWEGASTHSAADLLGHRDDEERTERDEAADWLRSYLDDHGGQAARKDVLRDARVAGFKEATVKRAKDKAQVGHESSGFPRQTVWTSPVGSPRATPAEGEPTGQGEPTGPDLHNGYSKEACTSANRDLSAVRC